MFKFHAQQGQEGAVCRILTAQVSKPKVVKTEKGVLITCEVPQGMSKRQIDRLLFANEIPGSHSRNNKYPVFEGDKYDLVYNDKVRDAGVFHWVLNGKFMGKHEVYYHDFGCGPECCGGYWDMRPVKRK